MEGDIPVVLTIADALGSLINKLAKNRWIEINPDGNEATSHLRDAACWNLALHAGHGSAADDPANKYSDGGTIWMGRQIAELTTSESVQELIDRTEEGSDERTILKGMRDRMSKRLAEGSLLTPRTKDDHVEVTARAMDTACEGVAMIDRKRSTNHILAA